MDACTIVEFRRALQQPESLFCTLHNVVVEIATLSRTKHFAECRATIDGKSAIIYAPITPQAMDYALRASLALAHTTGSRCITPMEIYGAEMRCGINLDKHCSLIVEYPLRGIPLRKAAYTTSHDRLVSAHEEFFAELEKLNISHNHLHADNIIVDNIGKWHPLRQYFSSKNVGGDIEAKQQLLAFIESYAIADGDEYERLYEDFQEYNTLEREVKEGRIHITDGKSVGFADEAGNIVIECRYLWASNFSEGRAVVMTHERRMGLIDYDGNHIIEPEYDEIIYDENSGTSSAVIGGRIFTFNYRGEKI